MTLQPSTTTVRRHVEVLAEVISLGDRRVLEVGCGGGRLLRWISRHAALACGIDPVRDQVAHARDQAPAARLAVARAEALPFAAASFDLVLFFNSLHHVPAAGRAAALAQAVGVMTADGEILVVEPLAEGPWFELLRPIDDETVIRAETQLLLEQAHEHGLEIVTRLDYASAIVEPNAAAARARLLAADPARADALAARVDDFSTRFERLGRPSAVGRTFTQPMRLHLLRRRQRAVDGTLRSAR